MLHNFSKKFFQTWLNFKKRQRLPKLANIKQCECELRTNNKMLLAEKRQRTLFSSILLKHYCIVISLNVHNGVGGRWGGGVKTFCLTVCMLNPTKHALKKASYYA